MQRDEMLLIRELVFSVQVPQCCMCLEKRVLGAGLGRPHGALQGMVPELSRLRELGDMAVIILLFKREKRSVEC